MMEEQKVRAIDIAENDETREDENSSLSGERRRTKRKIVNVEEV